MFLCVESKVLWEKRNLGPAQVLLEISEDTVHTHKNHASEEGGCQLSIHMQGVESRCLPKEKFNSVGSSVQVSGLADIRSPGDFAKKVSKFHSKQHNWNIWTFNKLNNLSSHLFLYSLCT